MKLTHFDEHGNARMVDVSEKDVTSRSACAVGSILVNEEILHKIEQQQKVIVYKEKVSAKRKLLTYSMKVMVAAAAAIAFLIVVPTVEQQSRPNMETYVAEAKEQVNKDLQEQKEKAKKRSEEQNFLQSVNDASSAFCNFITETTNGWFLKEER